MGPAGLSPLKASSSSSGGGCVFLDSQQERQGPSGAASPADSLDRGGPNELGIPVGAHDPSGGGMAGEPQAGLPAVPGGGSDLAAQVSQAASNGHGADGGSEDHPSERAMGDGPRPRRDGKRKGAPGVCFGGCPHAGVRGASSRAEVHGGRRGRDPLRRRRGAIRPPDVISVDQGTEFTSKSLDHWAYWNRVRLNFSRPGKPTDNAFAEAFNSLLRRECLSQHYFMDEGDVQRILDRWRADYNNFLPHESLARSTPAAFAASALDNQGAREPLFRIFHEPALGCRPIQNWTSRGCGPNSGCDWPPRLSGVNL